MFIRKSTYKALVESRDNWKSLCERNLALNESVLANNKKAIEVCQVLSNENKKLTEKLEKRYTESEGEE